MNTWYAIIVVVKRVEKEEIEKRWKMHKMERTKVNVKGEEKEEETEP